MFKAVGQLPRTRFGASFVRFSRRSLELVADFVCESPFLSMSSERYQACREAVGGAVRMLQCLLANEAGPGRGKLGGGAAYSAFFRSLASGGGAKRQSRGEQPSAADLDEVLVALQDRVEVSLT